MTALVKALVARFPDAAVRLSIVVALFDLRGAELDIVRHAIDRVVMHRRPA